MDEALIQAVWQRAGNACEYCLIPQSDYPAGFEIDHIIARQHGGPTVLSNLALPCLHCNSHKGPNIAGRDSRTKKLAPLYNPRRQKWGRHFRWRGPLVAGRTPVGRVTVAVLAMNGLYLVRRRRELIEEGIFPPSP